MDQPDKEILQGGNMNQPVKIGNRIYKEITAASGTIHNLLVHVRKKGIHWVPQSYGINAEGQHVLEFIQGSVPGELPDWIWHDSILVDIASRLRQWHDATSDFHPADAVWINQTEEPFEVICHCDFAPYNCVFENRTFRGLIDFDVCSPGSRLWDIAYTVYRFVPLLPLERTEDAYDVSPFGIREILQRLQLFLRSYSKNDARYEFNIVQVLEKTGKRLDALAGWSREFGIQNNKPSVIRDSVMYGVHADWIREVLLREGLSGKPAGDS